MLIINPNQLDDKKKQALNELQKRSFLSVNDEGISLTYQSQEKSLIIKNNGYLIKGTNAYFYRALSYLIAHPNEEPPKETMLFKHLSAMIDVSRNAVLKVEAAYDFICDMALAGYDRLMLYIEDTIELPTDPYFGYMRGRYSKEEINSIIQFADIFDIEVIPCIQTLAHLNQMKRWPVYRHLFDIQDILLVGEDETYAFIERLIQTVSETFTSKYINIGMDEAYLLGRGAYATKNGLHDKENIMVEHLSKVLNIVKQFDLKPMIWSDMFFKSGFQAYNENIKLPESIINKVDPSLTLVYWDYNALDENHYDVRFKLHEQFHNDLSFAGGSWTWLGFAPHISFASKACKAAINSAKKYHIQEFTLTFWGDNGGECPPYASLSVLRRAASYAYNIHDELKIDQTFKALYQIDQTLMNALELPDIIDESHQFRLVNPSKYLLYQDVFKGIFDLSITPNISKRYESYAKTLSEGQTHQRFGLLFQVLTQLTIVLSLKADLGVLTRKAYKNNDRQGLNELIKNRYNPLIIALELFYEKHRNRWMADHKPHGFDVQDYRLGGLIQRVKHQRQILLSYINNEIDKIDELEEEILPFNGIEANGYYFNSHQMIFTTNVV